MPSPSSATCVLALDQGTTSSRAILFDRRGTPIAVAQEEFSQHARSEAGPDGADLGIVEHDPEDIWRTQLSCARRVLASAGLSVEGVAAIGITGAATRIQLTADSATVQHVTGVAARLSTTLGAH